MKTTAFFCLVAIVSAATAFGNGGTFSTSDVYATGNLMPQQKRNISLEKESLFIALDSERARVQVDYVLTNHGSAEKATYGFPVDSMLDSFAGEAAGDAGIASFSIDDNDTRLSITKIIKTPGSESQADVTSQRYEPRRRNWYFAELVFARGETKRLHVSYTVRTYGTRSGTSKQYFWKESPRTFLYTFQPAQTWGNGLVKDLEIIADISALKQANASVEKVTPSGFKADGDRLVWHFQNYDLRTAPDLQITADTAKPLRHAVVTKARLDRRFIASITASSTLPPSPSGKTRYGVENLLDGNLNTAWIEGTDGPGIGEWIEITFKPGVVVNAIGVLNGYCKSEKALAENGQVLQMEVESLFRYGKNEERSKEMVQLQRTSFDSLLRNLPGAYAQWVVDNGEGHPVMRKVRLKITGAEQGTMSADTAITEIYICGHPAKESGD